MTAPLPRRPSPAILPSLTVIFSAILPSPSFPRRPSYAVLPLTPFPHRPSALAFPSPPPTPPPRSPSSLASPPPLRLCHLHCLPPPPGAPLPDLPPYCRCLFRRVAASRPRRRSDRAARPSTHPGPPPPLPCPGSRRPCPAPAALESPPPPLPPPLSPLLSSTLPLVFATAAVFAAWTERAWIGRACTE